MRVYLPNNSKSSLGGGFTFRINLLDGLSEKVQFVNSLDECDILLISGITMIDKSEVYQAKEKGKKIILRVDNVPKKSRNKRNTPYERLKEFGSLSDWIVFQSRWSYNYTEPLFRNKKNYSIIYNGVNQRIFYPSQEKNNNERYLFAYHGNSELKGFWQAHYYFQMYSRKNPESEFWFIYDFGRQLEELKNSNFDFWNGEKYKYIEKVHTSIKMSEIMRKCNYLIFPSFADASPNTVLEARACGLKILNCVKENESGTKELLDLKDISLERMSNEYLQLFIKLLE